MTLHSVRPDGHFVGDTMRRSLVPTGLFCLVVSLGLFPYPSRAETFSVAAGTQNFGPSECFRWVEASGTMGVQRVSTAGCANQSFIVPLYWKTFASAATNRIVYVRGRRNTTASQLTCRLYVINADGFVNSQVSGSFTTVGSYSLLSLSVNNVTTTSTSFLACDMTAQNTYLMNVQYTP